ncbi:hypothetical protein K402DRAFT_417983 [Aulographum hederae CBS 113979]|uniref:Peroxisomal biogenesis factor 11 n=1 Tax=Aulographum hederae CBS 113979 TaxID=1176131 RepID=A0A6G1H9M7_9PEZI|nr:hypothetical protein K402DRAFT_417983 [Aulographum hederae CBS 113979]
MRTTPASPSLPLHALLLTTTDTHLTRLTRLLSTPAGIDKSLTTTYYLLVLLHSRLSAHLNTRLTVLATAAAQKAAPALLPGETLFTTTVAPPSLARLARAKEATGKLKGLISDYRIFSRLWGLLAMYAWGKSVYASPPSDPVLRFIAYAQVGVNTVYQGMENAAYLAGHNVIGGWEPAFLGRWWAVASRFWMAHVVLDLVRLARVRQVRLAKREGVTVRDGGGEKKELEEEKRVVESRRREDEEWWRQFTVDAAYAPLTLHYSALKAVPEDWIGVLGTIAGGTGLRYMWKQLA